MAQTQAQEASELLLYIFCHIKKAEICASAARFRLKIVLVEITFVLESEAE